MTPSEEVEPNNMRGLEFLRQPPGQRQYYIVPKDFRTIPLKHTPFLFQLYNIKNKKGGNSSLSFLAFESRDYQGESHEEWQKYN